MPDNAADFFFDQAAKDAINLARVEAGSVLKVQSFLADLEAEIVKTLAQNKDLSPGKVAKLQAILKAGQDAIGTTYEAIATDNAADLKGVAAYQAKAVQKTMNAVVGVDVFGATVTESQLTALVKDSFIQGHPAADWWNAQSEGTKSKFTAAVNTGYALGEDIDAITRRIRGTKANGFTDGVMQASRREGEALARTAVQTISNNAKLESFKNLGDTIKGIEWLATLDTRTTIICRALDGKQWTFPDLKPVGHVKVFPGAIAHWNCRSTTIAVLYSWAEMSGKKIAALDGATLQAKMAEKLKAKGWSDDKIAKAQSNARATMDGQASGSPDMEAWLKKQPDAKVKAMLGPSRANLLATGKITVTDLTDQKNRPLTVAQLNAAIDAGDFPVETEGIDFQPFDMAKAKPPSKAAAEALQKAAADKIATVMADPKAKGNSILATNLAKIQSAEPGLSPAELLAKAEEATAAKIEANTKSSVLSKAKKKILAGEAPTAAQQALIDGLGEDEKTAWLEAIGDAKKVKAADLAAAKLAKLDAAIDGIAKTNAASVKSAADIEDLFDSLDTDGLGFFEKSALQTKLTSGLVTNKVEAVKAKVTKALAADPMADYGGASVNDVFELFDLDPKAASDLENFIFSEQAKAQASVTLKAWDSHPAKKYALDAAYEDALANGTPADPVTILAAAKDNLMDMVATDAMTNGTAASQKAIKALTGMNSPTDKSIKAWMIKEGKDAETFLVEWETLTAEKAKQATNSSVLSKAKKKVAAGEEMTPAQMKVWNELSSEEKHAFDDDVTALKDKLAAENAAKTAKLDGAKSAVVAGLPMTDEQAALIQAMTAAEKKKFWAETDALSKQAKAEAAKLAQAAADAQAQADAAAAAAKAAQAAADAQAKAAAKAAADALKKQKAAEKKVADLTAQLDDVPNPADMKFIKTLSGSTRPQLMEDATGKKWVVKSPDQGGGGKPHLQNEAAADEIYRLLGAEVPKSKFIEIDGKPYKVAEFLEGAKTLGEWERTATAAQIKEMHAAISRNFVADALMGNWDVLGQSNDNVMVLANGRPIRIDNGGALDFRAMGAKKTAKEWNGTVDELKTLRNPSTAAGQTAKVFSGLTDADIAAQIVELVGKRDELLAEVRRLKGDDVAKVFGERLDYLKAQLPADAFTSSPAAKAKRSDTFDTIPADIGKSIERARLNGASIPIGSTHVEDMQGLTWRQKNSVGLDVTVTQLKVTDEGSKAIMDLIGEELKKAAPAKAVPITAGPQVSGPLPDPYKLKWESLAKTLNTHKADGQFNAGTVATFQSELANIENQLADLKSFTGPKSAFEKAQEAQLQHYFDKGKILQAVHADYVKAHAAGTIPTDPVPWIDPAIHDVSNFSDDPDIAKAKAAKDAAEKKKRDDAIAAAKAAGKPTFTVTHANRLDMPVNSITNARAVGSGTVQGFEVELGSYNISFSDGTEVVFVPRSGRFGKDGSKAGLALEGTVQVRIPMDADHQSVMKTMDVLESLGVNTKAATDDYREMVWLSKTVYLHDDHTLAGWKKITDLPDGPPKIQAARDFIEKRYNVQVPKRGTPGYTADGVANSFGDGFKHVYRADLTRADAESQLKGYVLTHSTGADVAVALDAMLKSGGEATATTGRLRKGVNIGSVGMSASADIRTGGADFFFTRIRKTTSVSPGNIAFKIGNIARADAVSYTSDLYGQTGNRTYRKTKVDEYKAIASNGGSDETIFKNGLFLLDEIDFIKSRSPAHRQELLDVFRNNKITVMPDGRPIEDVVK